MTARDYPYTLDEIPEFDRDEWVENIIDAADTRRNER